MKTLPKPSKNKSYDKKRLAKRDSEKTDREKEEKKVLLD